jgi:hypothetical protein
LAIGLLRTTERFNYWLIKYLLSCLIIFSLVSLSIPVYAKAPIVEGNLTPPETVKTPPISLSYTKEDILAMIDEIALKYDVSPFVMKKIVYGESRYNPKAIGDTKYVCPLTGKVAPSYGLVQINSCWHKVSIEQSFDVEFSLNFLATHLKKGNCKLWTTCSNLFGET